MGLNQKFSLDSTFFALSCHRRSVLDTFFSNLNQSHFKEVSREKTHEGRNRFVARYDPRYLYDQPKPVECAHGGPENARRFHCLPHFINFDSFIEKDEI